MSLVFDIGANRGDACEAALARGFTKIIAVEAAPRIYKQLAARYIYSNVIPLRFAVSDKDHEVVEFYEAEEDGLSTLNKDWLTADGLPYQGKSYRTIRATTITVDSLVDIYGTPDLMKIDVEGAEWAVFRGMSKYHGMLTFEWTDVTLDEHEKQIDYLEALGYTEIAPQFITHHLEEPTEWFSIQDTFLSDWVRDNVNEWKETGWKEAGLRPTADVGMCWVR